MSKTHNNKQTEKPKVSKLAITAMVFGFLSLCTLLMRRGGICDSPGFVLGLMIFRISAVIAICLGLAAIIRIKGKRKSVLRGQWYAIIGMVVAIISFFGPRNVSLLRNRMLCSTNLSAIGKALFIYTIDNDGQYPTTNKWCDLIIRCGELSEKRFICKDALAKGDKGRCHYAMNPNCDPNSRLGIIWLFETKGGWNQFGGPELLTTENHGGIGCNILFNDGHVEFVFEEFGDLMWGDEQKQ